MKKRIAIILLLALIIFSVRPVETLASTNTHSGSFVLASSQSVYDNTDFGITGNVTIEAWIKPTTVTTGGTNIGLFQLGKASTGISYDLRFQDGLAAGGLRAVRAKHGVGNSNVDYIAGDFSGTWLHVVIWYDGTDFKLYTAPQGGSHTERGTIAASGSGNANNTFDGILIAGNDTDDNSTLTPAQFYGGLVDEVRVWNTARTTTQLDNNFETELVGNETGLVAYYKMNNDWNDTTANAYNLTASNSPTFSTTVPFTGAADVIILPERIRLKGHIQLNGHVKL